MKRKLLTILSILFALITAMGVMAACGPDEEPGVGGDEVGAYYYDAGSQEYLLTLVEDLSFTLKMQGEEQPGTYKMDEEGMLTLKFKDKNVGTITATHEEYAVTMTYEGVTYRFLKKVNFTVTFNNNGTTTNVQVMNGKTVQKPQDPSRNNYWFVGWYTDNTYKNVFSFTEPIFGLP